MRIALDTNLLTRSIQPDSLQHPQAREAIRTLRGRGEELCIFPQTLYEFWAVCTRPRGENGLGLTAMEAVEEMAKARSLFVLLARHDEAALLAGWERLVEAYQAKGRNAHDARIVAAMQLHSVTSILTFNTGDFARYTGLIVLSPELLAGTST